MSKYRFFVSIVFLFMLISCNKINKPASNESLQNIPSDQIQAIPVQVNMAYIPGGEYKPFYGSDTALVKVNPFLMDERAVTNSEFLSFVKANPQWQKSNIKKIFADTGYLRTWVSDTVLPKNAKPDAPICNVSWFAAKAFAESVNKRLPTLDEWEFVAMADAETANARSKQHYSDNIISLYLQKDRQYAMVKQSPPNYWKIYNMFDLIWEWTDDFNSILTTSDSRVGQYEDKSLFCAGSATSSTDILNYAAFMRFALRTSLKANYTIANLGFRCATDTTIHQNK